MLVSFYAYKLVNEEVLPVICETTCMRQNFYDNVFSLIWDFFYDNAFSMMCSDLWLLLRRNWWFAANEDLAWSWYYAYSQNFMWWLPLPSPPGLHVESGTSATHHSFDQSRFIQFCSSRSSVGSLCKGWLEHEHLAPSTKLHNPKCFRLEIHGFEFITLLFFLINHSHKITITFLLVTFYWLC